MNWYKLKKNNNTGYNNELSKAIDKLESTITSEAIDIFFNKYGHLSLEDFYNQAYNRQAMSEAMKNAVEKYTNKIFEVYNTYSEELPFKNKTAEEQAKKFIEILIGDAWELMTEGRAYALENFDFLKPPFTKEKEQKFRQFIENNRAVDITENIKSNF